MGLQVVLLESVWSHGQFGRKSLCRRLFTCDIKTDGPAGLRIPDSYGAKTTENQTPLSHFA